MSETTAPATSGTDKSFQEKNLKQEIGQNRLQMGWNLLASVTLLAASGIMAATPMTAGIALVAAATLMGGLYKSMTLAQTLGAEWLLHKARSSLDKDTGNAIKTSSEQAAKFASRMGLATIGLGVIGATIGMFGPLLISATVTSVAANLLFAATAVPLMLMAGGTGAQIAADNVLQAHGADGTASADIPQPAMPAGGTAPGLSAGFENAASPAQEKPHFRLRNPQPKAVNAL